jgi:hypothetical protein
MANHKIKLELTWIGKENRPRLEPRILIEDQAKSYHAAFRVSDKDAFDNRLIFGDNLLALKALEQEFAGKIKCIYIDPPYNTGSAFTHYDDGLDHSLWLSLMRDRLEILRTLLHNEAERDFRAPVIEKQDIRKMLFSGFKRGLRAPVKFDSDTERRFAAILENDKEVLKWFRPTRDEIRIDLQGDTSYEPDFVVETKAAKFVCETKASNEMAAPEVLAKAKAAAEWCGHATKHEGENGGKPWTYLLIPHDVITDNKTLKGLAASYSYRG